MTWFSSFLSRIWLPCCGIMLLFVGVGYGCRERPYRHLTNRLENNNLQTQQQTLRHIAKLGNKAVSALPELERALYQKGLTRQVTQTLVAIGSASVPVLKRALRHTDSIVREAVADALGSLGSSASSAIPALLSVIKTAQRDLEKFAAAQAIAEIGPTPDALRDLLPLLQDENPDLRRIAVFALGKAKRHSEPYLRELATASRDKNYKIREAAAFAMAAVGSKAIPWMIELLQSDETSVSDVHTKLCVLRAMHILGIRAQSALPTLISFMQYRSEHGTRITLMGLASSASLRLETLRLLAKLIKPSFPHRKVVEQKLQQILRDDASNEVKAIARSLLQSLKQGS